MSSEDYLSDNGEDEEEIIPDPNPQLIKLQDLLKQKNTLSRYKDLLEMEREVTLKRQFKRFSSTKQSNRRTQIKRYLWIYR